MATNKADTGQRKALEVPATVSATAATQLVRIGTAFDSGIDDMQITGYDTLIHIRDLASLDPSDFCVVAGQNVGDPIPGRAEYVASELEVYAHAGWIYGSGHYPKLRTKRTRIIGTGTTVMLEVISAEAPSAPEDGSHRAFFLDTEDGESAEVQLLDGSDNVIASITIECSASPPSDTSSVAYVVPGQEAYVEITPKTTDLDASKDVTKEPAGSEPGDFWTGDDLTFITDVKSRVAAVIS